MRERDAAYVGDGRHRADHTLRDDDDGLGRLLQLTGLCHPGGTSRRRSCAKVFDDIRDQRLALSSNFT